MLPALNLAYTAGRNRNYQMGNPLEPMQQGMEFAEKFNNAQKLAALSESLPQEINALAQDPNFKPYAAVLAQKAQVDPMGAMSDLMRIKQQQGDNSSMERFNAEQAKAVKASELLRKMGENKQKGMDLLVGDLRSFEKTNDPRLKRAIESYRAIQAENNSLANQAVQFDTPVANTKINLLPDLGQAFDDAYARFTSAEKRGIEADKWKEQREKDRKDAEFRRQEIAIKLRDAKSKEEENRLKRSMLAIDNEQKKLDSLGREYADFATVKRDEAKNIDALVTNKEAIEKAKSLLPLARRGDGIARAGLLFLSSKATQGAGILTGPDLEILNDANALSSWAQKFGVDSQKLSANYESNYRSLVNQLESASKVRNSAIKRTVDVYNRSHTKPISVYDLTGIGDGSTIRPEKKESKPDGKKKESKPIQGNPFSKFLKK